MIKNQQTLKSERQWTEALRNDKSLKTKFKNTAFIKGVLDLQSFMYGLGFRV